MPLKTYLPDGDIDLTALSSLIVEETLARDVIAVLQGEEQNDNAEYEVKDTQFIDAEVFSILIVKHKVCFSFNILFSSSIFCLNWHFPQHTCLCVDMFISFLHLSL